MNKSKKNEALRIRNKRVATGFKVSDLAKTLGMTTKTIYYLRANHGAPHSTDPAEWKKYLEQRATETGSDKSLASAPKEYQKLRIRLLRAQAGKEEAVRKLRELELARKANNLVPMSEAKEAIRKVMEPLRNLLDALPKAAAHQVNPNNPAFAEEAIRDHLDKVYMMMEKESSKTADRTN